MDGAPAQRRGADREWALSAAPVPQRAAPSPGRAAAPAGPPESRWRRVFPGDARQLGLLRRWLSSLLPPCPARDDVACVASELAANAIRHSTSGQSDWFAVEITRHPTMVRVAVADSGAASGPREVDDPDSESGRGMVLIRELSARYGVHGDHRGRLVWADVPWADPASPSPAQEPGEAAIRHGEDCLAQQFAGTPAWFGRATHQWWALTTGHGLISAPTAQQLATTLAELAGGQHWRPRPRHSTHTRSPATVLTPPGKPGGG